MPADHDDRIDDEVLQRVVAELRRPVRLDPALDAGALQRIRAEAGGRPAAAPGRRWGAVIAGAAIAAGLLLAVSLRHQGEPAEPLPLAVPSFAGTPAASGDARPVYLRLDAPASSRVAVVGDFNDWDPSRARFRGHQAHGAGDGRNVGVALAFESAKHGRDLNAEAGQPIEKPLGVVRRAGGLLRGVNLDRGHFQLVGHFEFHAQPCVDAGEYAQRPFFPGFNLPVR
jgi:hypothetical protein